MLANKQLNFVIIVLIFIGAILFFYKWLYVGVPLVPSVGEKDWLVEAKFIYNARGLPTKVQFSIPDQQPNFIILNENFISPDYGILTKVTDGNRYVLWSKRLARGRETLYYRVTLARREKPVDVNYKGLKFNDQQTKYSESEKTAIAAIIEEAKKKSADTPTLVSRILQILNQATNQNAATLLGRDYSSKKIAMVAARILNQIDIKAIPIEGLMIKPEPLTRFVSWLMIQDKNKWLYYNPESGEENLPDNFLIWHMGAVPLYKIEGGRNPILTLLKSQIDVQQTFGQSDLKRRSKLMDFALSNLPLPSQQILQILLTIPIGALIILFFRNYVGIATFGTFMPVLIAIAFFNMNLFWGTFLFILIVTFGLLVRLYLDKLYLLLVPRLAAILVTVVLFITTISVVLYKLDLDVGASAALFPIVILTMTIEKMCNLWDERGAKEAIKTGVGSLVVAMVAFLVMSLEILQYLFFNFPELNLILLAAILLFGQYRGFRLTELRRFKVLAG